VGYGIAAMGRSRAIHGGSGPILPPANHQVWPPPPALIFFLIIFILVFVGISVGI